MELVKKVMLPLTLSLGMFSSAALADEFRGYVSFLATGPQPSTVFNSSLLGMSSTDGGTTELYVFLGDSDYLNMVVSAAANHEVIEVYHESGSVTGVYYR